MKEPKGMKEEIVSVRISTEQKETLENLARAAGVSRSTYVRKIIKEGLDMDHIRERMANLIKEGISEDWLICQFESLLDNAWNKYQEEEEDG